MTDSFSASYPVTCNRNMVFKTPHTKLLSKMCLYKQERAHRLPEQHNALASILKVTPSISYLERSTASVMGEESWSPGAYVCPAFSALCALRWLLSRSYQYLLRAAITSPCSCCISHEGHKPQKHNGKWSCT